MNTKKLQRTILINTLVTVVLTMIFAPSANSQNTNSQTQRPISKEGLFKAIQIGGLSNQELSSYVSTLGVDFRLSDDDRSSLLKTGLERSVVEAIASNYRLPEPPKPTPAELEAAQVVQLSNGGALTQEDLVNHLKGGVTPAVLEKVVEKRGIQFSLSQESAKAIENAGGDRALIGVLLLKQPLPSAPAPAPVQAQPLVQQLAVIQTPAPVIPPPPTPKPEVPQQPLQAAAKTISQASLLKREELIYPALAKREKIAGSVRCEVTIDEKGMVTKVRTIAGHPVLSAAAEDSIKRWRYNPAKLDGKAVPSSTLVEVNFKPISN